MSCPDLCLVQWVRRGDCNHDHCFVTVVVSVAGLVSLVDTHRVTGKRGKRSKPVSAARLMVGDDLSKLLHCLSKPI